MDQTKQPRGNFIGYYNRRKLPGDNKPAFEGYTTKPDSADQLPIATWVHTYTDKETGEPKTMFGGTVGCLPRNMSAAEQLTRIAEGKRGDVQKLGSLTLEPGTFVAFPNRFKTEAPEKDRPEFWGGINYGDGSPVHRLSIWLKKRNGETILAGATSLPQPGKTEAEMQDAEIHLADTIVDTADATSTQPKRQRKTREAASPDRA